MISRLASIFQWQFSELTYLKCITSICINIVVKSVHLKSSSIIAPLTIFTIAELRNSLYYFALSYHFMSIIIFHVSSSINGEIKNGGILNYRGYQVYWLAFHDKSYLEIADGGYQFRRRRWHKDCQITHRLSVMHSWWAGEEITECLSTNDNGEMPLRGSIEAASCLVKTAWGEGWQLHLSCTSLSCHLQDAFHRIFEQPMLKPMRWIIL